MRVNLIVNFTRATITVRLTNARANYLRVRLHNGPLKLGERR